MSFVYDPPDANPYPTYRYLRERAPVHFWEQGGGYLVSRHDDVVTLLRDKRFSSTATAWGPAAPEPRSEGERLQRRLMALSFFGLPRDDHVRVRRLVTPVFSMSAAESLRKDIRAIVGQVLHELPGNDVLDLVEDYAGPIPVRFRVPCQYG